MAKMSLIETIKSLGLSDHEAQVYMAGLKLGPTTVLSLARLTGIHRTVVYTIIDTLKAKGLMHEEAAGFKTKFVADSPERLELALERKRAELHEALPKLMEIYNTEGAPATFRVYTGLEAVKGMYEEMLRELKPHDEYEAVANHALWADLDPKFFFGFLERRKKLRTHNRILLENDERGRISQSQGRNYQEDIRLLPKGVSLTTNLLIAPRLMIMHSTVDPIVGIALTDKNFIKMQKEYFEVMWSVSGEN